MDDQTLLSQYVATRNASAFEELTRRYSNLVRGICIRLLGNSHDAEEVTQECFFELARHASEVHTSVAGWLQRAANSRSLNLLRSRSRRKFRERAASLDLDSATSQSEFAEPELQQLINGALKELPDDLRLPVVLHYVDGQTQRDVATKLGVNQSTISRRMQDALRQLRDKLTQAGYAASAPAVMILMQDHAAAATTESTLTDAAVTGTAGKGAIGTTLISSLKGSTAALLPLLSFLLFGGWVFLLTCLCLFLYIARYRPIWVSEVMSSFGVSDFYRKSTLFLDQHEWKTVSNTWKPSIRISLFWSLFFVGLTLTFAFGTNQPPWGTVAMGAFIASAFFVQAIRIWRHNEQSNSLSTKPVRSISLAVESTVLPTGEPSNELAGTWFEALQLVWIGLAAVAVSLSAISFSGRDVIWPAIFLCTTIGIAMLYRGVQLGRRLLMRNQISARDADLAVQTEWTSFGTFMVTAIGVAIVALLSSLIFWNPATVPNLSLSLAAAQTLVLGWIVYRIAASCRFPLSRNLFIAILFGCLVANSSVCLANWLPL